MIKQVNHGKDDPGKIYQEVFPENLLCLVLHEDLWGIWKTSSPKVRAHSSPVSQPYPIGTLPCLQNVSAIVPLVSTATTTVTVAQARQTRPCSMPGLTSLLVSLLTIPHIINWDLAYSGFKTP